jgi:hypothetical protein
MRKAILACVFLLLGSGLLAQQGLDNQSVTKLVRAGLSEDLIVTTINSSPGTYDTSANGLIALKKAGASDKVIAAIVIKASGATAAAPAPASSAGSATSTTSVVLAQGALPDGVDTVGVYYLDNTGSHWQEVPAEVVNFKSEGALKHYASAGLLKGEMTGLVGGNRSPLTEQIRPLRSRRPRARRIPVDPPARKRRQPRVPRCKRRHCPRFRRCPARRYRLHP